MTREHENGAAQMMRFRLDRLAGTAAGSLPFHEEPFRSPLVGLRWGSGMVGTLVHGATSGGAAAPWSLRAWITWIRGTERLW
jgi:hypothetical protein